MRVQELSMLVSVSLAIRIRRSGDRHLLGDEVPERRVQVPAIQRYLLTNRRRIVAQVRRELLKNSELFQLSRKSDSMRRFVDIDR
jgi:hypothetical protein